MSNNTLHKLGIDIGSTTVKVAVLDENDNLLFSDYERHFANIRETLSLLVEKAYKQLGDMQIAPMITGSGGLTLAKHLDVPFVQEGHRRSSPYPLLYSTMHHRPMLPSSLAVRMQRSFISRAAMWNSV